LNIKTAWTLNKGSSVFTAELQGIKQALQIAYNLEHNPPAITIFSYSSSAIQAILSSELPDNEAIPDIHELIHSLKSSGTQTTLVWIPSHTGIEGNEEADKLATYQSSLESTNIINLSPSEITSIFKKHWTENHLQFLKTCQKRCITFRSSLHPIV
jgi:hypothetical protein